MSFFQRIRKLLSWQNFAYYSAYGIGFLLLFVGALSIIQGINLTNESESTEIYNIDSDTTEIVVNDDEYIFDSLYNAAKLQYDNKQYKEAQSTLAKMDSEYLSLQKVKDLSDAIVERVHESHVAEPIKEKDVTTVPEPIAKPLTQKERFDNAKKEQDWNSMKQLADEGYSPAYLPLARYYMKNFSQHGLAKKYAEKAQEAGLSGAKEILNELDDLDF